MQLWFKHKVFIYFRLLIISVVFSISGGSAQSPRFQIVYGGVQRDLFKSVDTLINGKLLVTGESKSYGAGNTDLLLCVLDSFGVIQSSYCYGGAFEDGAGRRSVKLQDGGRLLLGYTKSFGTNIPNAPNGIVIKIDSLYAPLWSRVIGDSGNDNLYDAFQLPNDTFIYLCGSTTSQGNGNQDILLLKMTNSGALIWQKTYGTVDEEYSWQIRGTKDNKLAILGTRFITNVFNSEDFTLMKVDTSGAILWSKIYGGPLWDGPAAFLTTIDSGYIVVAGGYSYGAGSQDIYLLKLDKLGNIQWFNTYGDIYDDLGCNLEEYIDPNGITRHYYICGYSPGLEDTAAAWGNYRGFILSTDPVGQQEWVRHYGPGPSDYIMDMKVLGNTDFIVCGAGGGVSSGDLDGWLIRTDAIGATMCNHFGTGTTQLPFSMPVSSSCFVVPCSLNVMTPPLVFTTAIPITTVICSSNFPVSLPENTSENMHLITFPNPSDGVFTVSFPEGRKGKSVLRIFDKLGRCVYTSSFIGATYSVDLSSDLLPGVYFVEVTSPGFRAASKALITFSK